MFPLAHASASKCIFYIFLISLGFRLFFLNSWLSIWNRLLLKFELTVLFFTILHICFVVFYVYIRFEFMIYPFRSFNSFDFYNVIPEENCCVSLILFIVEYKLRYLKDGLQVRGSPTVMVMFYRLRRYNI